MDTNVTANAITYFVNESLQKVKEHYLTVSNHLRWYQNNEICRSISVYQPGHSSSPFQFLNRIMRVATKNDTTKRLEGKTNDNIIKRYYQFLILLSLTLNK